MKTFQLLLSCFFFLALAFYAQSQTGEIRGTVLDAKTAEPLPFSNIFINNTTLGVAADQNGKYTLNNIPAGFNEIVFSFVGYQPYQKKIQIKSGESLQLDIRLLPVETELETVVVTGTQDKEWNKQLRKFEKVFFGNTKFATSCKILNAWVLDFKESEINGKSLFTATASRPLEIENAALGYQIDYHLKSLVSTTYSYKIIGEVRFQELINKDPILSKIQDQNRLEAYYGSLRHLLKSMVAGTVEKDGFKLYTDKSGYENSPYRTSNFASQLDKTIELFNTGNLVTPGKNEGEFTLPLTKRMEVHYTQARSNAKVYSDITYPVSWIEVTGGPLKVNSSGIVLNPGNLVVSGSMNNARVADLLPYNYQPEATPIFSISKAENTPHQRLNRLEEKVYIHTDKPYYYPGEKIWFKAYLNYQSPEMMDSLSKVLYVELIDKNKKIMQTKLLFIDGGACAGSFDLPEELESGSFFIRSYTNWMLNYEPETLFVKSIPLLGLYECPETDLTNIPPKPATLELKFNASKSHYRPREKIKLEFELRDTDGTPIPVDLSVSVTDSMQVTGLMESRTILNSFLFLNPDRERKFPAIKYLIESGVTVAGQYKNKKGKPASKTFAITDLKSNKIIPVETDVLGNFWISGFQFYDSAKLAFQEFGKQKKFEGTINLLNRYIPSSETLTGSTPLRIIKSELPQRIKLAENPAEETTVLQAVIINEEKPEELDKEIIPKAYSKADVTISGTEILEASRSSLVNAIRARVPGLNVVGGYLRIGGPSNFMGPSTTEPMLVVDGLQFAGGGTDSNYNRLMQINPEIVQRVDVIRYGGGAIYGTRGGNGVIIVTTKDGEYGSKIPPPTSMEPQYTKLVTLAGYSRAEEFVSPDYSNSVRNFTPDNRSTIFWSPSVRTDEVFGTASVSFYAADLITKYRIVVEGITDFGEPVRGVFHINISE